LIIIEFGPRLFGIGQFIVIAYMFKQLCNLIIYLVYKEEFELHLPWAWRRDEEKNELAT